MLKLEINPCSMTRQQLIDTATFLMKLAGVELLPRQAEPVAPSFTPPEELHKLTPQELLVSTAVTKKEVDMLANVPMQAPVPWPALTSLPVGLPGAINPNGLGWVNPDHDTSPRPIRKDAELDANGTPWDSRIHSRTRTKNPNGTWKVQRGIDLKKVEEISEQNKAILSFSDVPAPNDEPEPMNFATLMLKITGLVKEGKLTQAQVVEAVQSVGVPSLPVLPVCPELIPAVSLYIDNLI